MAMTKKERAEFDAALAQAKLLGALRWTSPVKKDVPTPEGGNYSVGWDVHVYSGVAFEAWSGCETHGRGKPPITCYLSASQNSCWLYSTKELALMALRHETEIECAIKLAKIDALLSERAKERG